MSPTSYRTAPPRVAPRLGTKRSIAGRIGAVNCRFEGRAVTSDALLALPKVQLHCHLEGTMRPATFLELGRRYGIDDCERLALPAEQVYAFDDFRGFLLLFRDVARTLQQPADYARLASDYVMDAAAQGVVYSEVFISPSVWTYFHHDLDLRATVEAIRTVFDREGSQHGIQVALIADLTRNFGAERALQTVRKVITMADLGIVGVGLGGDEANFPPEWYADAFAVAREHGLHCVVHAGEAAGPASVRAAIDVLHAERIGHGVRAIEDPALVEELARRRIALEMCPTSNRLTGAVPPGEDHPMARFDAAGVPVTIDADDPALFGTTLLDEYAIAEGLVGYDGVVRFIANAIDASFAGDELKGNLRARLAAVADSGV